MRGDERAISIQCGVAKASASVKGSSVRGHTAAQPFLQADVPSARRLSQTLGRKQLSIEIDHSITASSAFNASERKYTVKHARAFNRLTAWEEHRHRAQDN